ncbi:hypothetical protein [Roseibium album]|uniref:hypothetical protein n=1 Tax=Roseibium album TaxID=311410 RepID=UPI001187709A|nr:hypothetical protein [Roseibium album]
MFLQDLFWTESNREDQIVIGRGGAVVKEQEITLTKDVKTINSLVFAKYLSEKSKILFFGAHRLEFNLAKIGLFLLFCYGKQNKYIFRLTEDSERGNSSLAKLFGNDREPSAEDRCLVVI